VASIWPQAVRPYQEEGRFIASGVLSSLWGYRLSATEIAPAAYLLARVISRPSGRVLHTLRCLVFGEDRETFYRRMHWYLTEVGMARQCVRVEWEVLEGKPVAVPRTFDLIGPCSDSGLSSFLESKGFEAEERWDYREGAAYWREGVSLVEDAVQIRRSEKLWRDCSRRYYGALLSEPGRPLSRSALERVVPGGVGRSLFLPLGQEGPVGQWCPDVAPLIENQGRWEDAAARVETVRVLRFLAEGLPQAPPDHPCPLPASAAQLFPRIQTLQAGPLSVRDDRTGAWWEEAGFPVAARLTLYARAL
jgi:hypothetical protein